MVHFNIDSQLRETWEPTLNRQLQLILSPLLSKIKQGNVNFRIEHDREAKTSYFCCEFQGYDSRKKLYYAYTQSTEGIIAIHDAFSRVRRTILREPLLNISGSKVVSISTKQAISRVSRDF